MESLFITDWPKDPSEQDTSMWALAGLHEYDWHDKKQQSKMYRKYYSVRILTTLLGACPWATTPRRCMQLLWIGPEEGSFPSWTLRPPQMGRPSSSPPRVGGGGGISSSSFSFLLEERASVSLNDESDTTLRGRPFRVPVAFFLAFFSGTS